jgi:hypothetical protein
MSLSLAAWVVPYSAIWLGKAMVSTVTTGSKIAVQGDFRYFVIVDRIGMDIDRVRRKPQADWAARDLLLLAQYQQGARSCGVADIGFRLVDLARIACQPRLNSAEDGWPAV